MLNPISIKITIIFLFLPDYLLAAAHLIYFQKLRLDMIKRRRAMLLCAVGFWFFYYWKWLYVSFFCFSNKAGKPAERQIQSNGSFHWKLGGSWPHASSLGIKAPCLVAAGFISVTVTGVWSYFSPPRHSHFCVCTVYLPLLSHANTVYWQYACLSSFSLLSYLLCTAGNSKVVLASQSYHCSRW